jgi:Fe-Mn family superoxide dismutase
LVTFQNSITAEKLGQLMDMPDRSVILDARRAKAFEKSDQIIPTAEWINHEKAAECATGLPEGASAIVYCVHGHEVSQNAAEALRSVGVDAVFPDGDIEGYIEVGFETEKK